MGRTTMESLDRTDRDILALLQTDGRLTGAEIGRRVGLSQPAASARIQRLEKNGVITGYRAVVDPTALGLNIHAVIRLRTTHAQLSRSGSPERTASSSTSIARRQDGSKKSSTHLPVTALSPRPSCSAPTPRSR
jgi:DNA-binding Lrp family transcriptional regulator